MPKQFVKLFQDKSLFQLTVERNSKVCDKNFIVSNTEQYFLAVDQLEELNSQFLLEPIGRNTAPAIALACMALDKEEIVLVTPSDHLIKDEVEYAKVLQKAKELANEDNLVTFGIKPTFAETGFGYIQAKPENDNAIPQERGQCSIFNVELFHEKPNLKIAEKYIEENSKLSIQNLPLKFLWNSGMFMFKAGVFLDELKKYAPEIFKSCQVAFDNKKIQNCPHSCGVTPALRIQHPYFRLAL
jgi:mannose-1-phosphate guanylyltransferase